ncbi:hypothetical protein [Adhaeribacter pallidiroseus]|uniref:Uncharacterized protein n=1 Tax=Adhaeribacter pallidiroseus TaxID=2072847 RepID=A0A369QK81_9BACT|nr:hypothetical protein [Adhaeribacter pallidiroseus]RDC65144.1 hypothetical protein AHMF7616_03774 [Adhaeribacter pallidiroseus]
MASTLPTRLLLQNLTHYLAGLVLLLKGITKLAYYPEHRFYVLAFLLAGCIIVCGTFFHHTLEKRFRYITALFHLIEAGALFLLGYLYAHEGKQYLPYPIYAAAVMFFIAAMLGIIRHRSSLPHV